MRKLKRKNWNQRSKKDRHGEGTRAVVALTGYLGVKAIYKTFCQRGVRAQHKMALSYPSVLRHRPESRWRPLCRSIHSGWFFTFNTESRYGTSTLSCSESDGINSVLANDDLAGAIKCNRQIEPRTTPNTLARKSYVITTQFAPLLDVKMKPKRVHNIVLRKVILLTSNGKDEWSISPLRHTFHRQACEDSSWASIHSEDTAVHSMKYDYMENLVILQWNIWECFQSILSSARSRHRHGRRGRDELDTGR